MYICLIVWHGIWIKVMLSCSHLPISSLVQFLIWMFQALIISTSSVLRVSMILVEKLTSLHPSCISFSSSFLTMMPQGCSPELLSNIYWPALYSHRVYINLPVDSQSRHFFNTTWSHSRPSVCILATIFLVHISCSLTLTLLNSWLHFVSCFPIFPIYLYSWGVC